MRSIHLDDAELTMLRSAVHMYVDSFGHNEADVVERAKALMAKLNQAGDDDVTDATQLIG
jgi:hypothetical protein